jgi:phosphoglucomutase
VSTGAYSPEAALHVNSADHGALKSRYQKIFLREWEERKNELKTRYGIYSWEAAAYNGINERRGIADFGEAGKGGLKICFYNENGTAIASIWMRGSATEPVFRVMADAEGSDVSFERDLIEWQRRMTTASDESFAI